MAKIYVDCGHGGNDPGAIGFNRKESDIVLNVGKLLKIELERQGHQVKISRNGDNTVSLNQRTNEANTWGADILISIHTNAFNGSAYGFEVFCYKFAYRKLADCIHKTIVNDGLFNFNRGVKEGNLHMVRESNMSACLIELAFIDNAKDIELLNNKQKEFAIAICKGIQNYFGQDYKGEVVNMEEYKDFNEKYYLWRYKDVENAVKNGQFKNGEEHYVKFGKNEGREGYFSRPSDWDEVRYLQINDDVRNTVNKGNMQNGFYHYSNFGIMENRKYK